MKVATTIHIVLPTSVLVPSEENRDVAERSMCDSGRDAFEWAFDVDQSRPIDVLVCGTNLRIGDGHHRHLAAEILRIPLQVRVFGVDLTPAQISEITARGGTALAEESRSMFTIKLYSVIDQNPDSDKKTGPCEHTYIREATSVTVRRMSGVSEVIAHTPGDDYHFSVGPHAEFNRAIIENSFGKTTEIVGVR